MNNNLKPGDVYLAFIQPVCNYLYSYENWDELSNELSKLDIKLKNLYVAHCAITEICNGGIDQYFFNSAGILGPESVIGFEALGMFKCAEAVQHACQMLGTPYPRDRFLRQQILEDLRDSYPENNGPFDDLDKTFYKYMTIEAGGWETAADTYILSD